MQLAKIGCCSSFKACSNAGKCVEVDSLLYEEFFSECYYEENLSKGLNFYTEYNENNQARADEYKLSQMDDKVETEPINELLGGITLTSETIDNKFEIKNDKYKNAYIVIDDRQFFIGTRGGYKNYTFSLGSNGIIKLIEDLKNYSVEIDTDYVETKFIDEQGCDTDRAEWRVHIIIADISYHIVNSNFNTIRRDTAIMLADHFSDLGFKASCECLVKDKSILNERQPSRKIEVDTPKHDDVIPEVENQISLFDF